MFSEAKELNSFLSVRPWASDLTSQASVFTPVKWDLCTPLRECSSCCSSRSALVFLPRLQEQAAPARACVKGSYAGQFPRGKALPQPVTLAGPLSGCPADTFLGLYYLLSENLRT